MKEMVRKNIIIIVLLCISMVLLGLLLGIYAVQTPSTYVTEDKPTTQTIDSEKLFDQDYNTLFPSVSNDKTTQTIDYEKLFDRQLRFYDFAIKSLAVLIAFITLVIGFATIFILRDRKAMREEIVGEAKKDVKDAEEKTKGDVSAWVDEIKKYAEGLKRDMLAKKEEVITTGDQAKEKMLKSALSVSPPGEAKTEEEGKAYKLLKEGNKFYNSGDYNTAIASYTKAIIEKRDFAKAYNNRGNAYDEKGDYETAIQDYSKAIELDPNLAAAYNNRGFAYYNKGDYEAAIQDCSKAIELDPNYAVAMASLGSVYSLKNDKEKAKEWYERALETGKLDAETEKKVKELLKRLK
jgi:tetratricopeptide (TPR) repeat protein